jgi:predicted nucleic acid-binding protein
MLFDTDILIRILRGNIKAAGIVDAESRRLISLVTYMELVQGARNRQELRQIKGFLSDAGFHVIPLSDEIGHRASIYIEEYGLGTSLGVADALIAATAVETNQCFCTGNKRHYRTMKELEIKEFRP